MVEEPKKHNIQSAQSPNYPHWLVATGNKEVGYD